jgi:hypothetical protein
MLVYCPHYPEVSDICGGELESEACYLIDRLMWIDSTTESFMYIEHAIRLSAKVSRHYTYRFDMLYLSEDSLTPIAWALQAPDSCKTTITWTPTELDSDYGQFRTETFEDLVLRLEDEYKGKEIKVSPTC